MIRCLQDSRSKLSKDCQASLFDQEVKMAEDIDFKYPLKRACSLEIQTFCAGVQHGHANVIRLALYSVEMDVQASQACRYAGYSCM